MKSYDLLRKHRWIASSTKRFLQLAPPDNAALSKMSAQELYTFGKSAFSIWQSLMCDMPLEVGGIKPSAVLSTPADWMKAGLIAGAYYDTISTVILNLPPSQRRALPPGFISPSWAFESKPVHDPIIFRLWSIGVNYLMARIYIYFCNDLRLHSPLFGITDRLYGNALTSLSDLYHMTRSSPDDLTALAVRLTGSVFKQIKSMYSFDEDDIPDYKRGVFSSLSANDIPDLAARHKRAIAKYEERTLDKAFESQLSLLIQSLGYLVISTRRGKATVDLICISTDPTDPYTFLVEAKTSSKPYSLPRGDMRAIVDYAKDVKASLRTLPPLAFIIIAGPHHTSTINRKISSLEACMNVPTRYCPATVLAALREQLPGPAPAVALRQSVLHAPPVLGENWVSDIVQYTDQQQQAHRQFVESLLQGFQNRNAADF